MASWSPLLLLLVGVAAAAAREQFGCSLGINKEACRAICPYSSSPLFVDCQMCYPTVCSAHVEMSALSASLVVGPDCVDDAGVAHALYSSWNDDSRYPCVLHVCHAYGRIQSIDLGGSCLPEPTHLGECSRQRNVGHCCYNYTCTIPNDSHLRGCVDATYTARDHGETWYDDPDHVCITYTCNDGTVSVLQNMLPLCPPAPRDTCLRYRDAGQCCYSYNCTVLSDLRTCRRRDGGLQAHSSIWYDDLLYPCVGFICRDGQVSVIVNKTVDCEPPPAGQACTRERALGACCYNYTCGCEYAGQRYAEGDQFPDNQQHPCQLLTCSAGVVQVITNETCPVLFCTNQVWPIFQCCRSCAPCVFNGVEYPTGATWFDDDARPCVQYRCVEGHTVVLANTTCEPAPHSGCFPWYMDGVCCPKWDCTDGPCVVDGVTHDHGTTWPTDPLRPCRHLRCDNGTVLLAFEEPPCAQPGPGCVARPVNYQCCPAIDCVTITCKFGNITYTEGQEWVDDPLYPCKRWRCTKEGSLKVFDLTGSCAPLVPPDCPNERTLGECCKSCRANEPECIDSLGVSHPPNSTYFEDPDTECRLFRCNGVVPELILDRTELCGPDFTETNGNCIVLGIVDCCPVYQCPNCTFTVGTQQVVYLPGDKWWDDDTRRCTRYMCQPDGTTVIILTRKPCRTVRAGCVPNYRGHDCCHYKYTCMFDPFDNLIPMP